MSMSQDSNIHECFDDGDYNLFFEFPQQSASVKCVTSNLLQRHVPNTVKVRVDIF